MYAVVWGWIRPCGVKSQLGSQHFEKKALESKKMSEKRDIPGPSKKLCPDDDDHDEKLPGPKPSPFLCKSYCFSRILQPYDVMPTNPELYIDAYQGLFLFDSPETKFFLVFDDEDKSKSYNMLFSHYVTWEFVLYSISADWETFVNDHNLKAGDEISFYRFSDRNVCDGYYYVLKYVKKSSGGKDDDDAQNSEKTSDVVAEVEGKKKKPGPGSRLMPTEACCLSKILTPHEVVQENLQLFFDPQNAINLTGCPEIVQYPPGTYSKDLFVFDRDDRQYTMKLSHRVSVDPGTSYVLNTGWGTFLRTQGLKEGDRIVFYRFFDKSVCEEGIYYTLRSKTCVAETSASSDVASDDCMAVTTTKLEYLKAREAELTALLEMCSRLEKEYDDDDDDDDDVPGAN